MKDEKWQNVYADDIVGIRALILLEGHACVLSLRAKKCSSRSLIRSDQQARNQRVIVCATSSDL
jgi:hypothetical protein